jgi:hypothetical protein
MQDDWKTFFRSLIESIACIDKKYFEVDRYDQEPAMRERAYCYELYHQLRKRLCDNFPYTLHGEIDKSGNIEESFKKEICSIELSDDESIKKCLTKILKPDKFQIERVSNIIKASANGKKIELDFSRKKFIINLCRYKLNKDNFIAERDGSNYKIFKSIHPNPDFVVHHPGGTSNLAVMEVKRYNCSKAAMENDVKKLKEFLNKPNPYTYGIFLIYGPSQENIKKFLTKYKRIDANDAMDLKDCKIFILCHETCKELPKIYCENGYLSQEASL